MKKIQLFVCGSILALTTQLHAQGLFWAFDDNQTPMMIPAECEARFDEVHGGVFTPTIEELLNYGQEFLAASSLSVKQQGAYCILGAAVQGNADAQYILAQLYEKGTVLPQDDLSAYKWAFTAAMNGKKEAQQLTLLLEQFLTTDELAEAHKSTERMKNEIKDELSNTITSETEELESLRTGKKKEKSTETKQKPTDKMKNIMPDVKNIFNEKDRLK